jgi:hypothetical protein
MKPQNYLASSFILLVISLTAIGQSKDFGNKDWISNGLEGKIYLLPEETQKLPDFDTMKTAGSIYTKEINVPARSWTEGFPGVSDRFEWFGIEYKGTFRVKRAGHYRFDLNSDDGAQLFIDDSLVIDNDGLHSPRSVNGEIDLDNSVHHIRIKYYQGPRTDISLQLSAQYENDTPQVFPGDQFVVSTPTHQSAFFNPFQAGLLTFLLMILVSLILFFTRKWKKNGKTIARN